MDNLELFKYAVTQGGLTIAFIVLFLSYRKDLKERASTEQESKRVLIDLVSENKVAIQQLTDLIRERRT